MSKPHPCFHPSCRKPIPQGLSFCDDACREAWRSRPLPCDPAEKVLRGDAVENLIEAWRLVYREYRTVARNARQRLRVPSADQASARAGTVARAIGYPQLAAQLDRLRAIPSEGLHARIYQRGQATPSQAALLWYPKTGWRDDLKNALAEAQGKINWVYAPFYPQRLTFHKMVCPAEELTHDA